MVPVIEPVQVRRGEDVQEEHRGRQRVKGNAVANRSSRCWRRRQRVSNYLCLRTNYRVVLDDIALGIHAIRWARLLRIGRREEQREGKESYCPEAGNGLVEARHINLMRMGVMIFMGHLSINVTKVTNTIQTDRM